MQEEEKQIKYYKIKKEQKQELLSWWEGLLTRNGPRALLRRCVSPEEAALCSDTLKVKAILVRSSYEAAAAIAGILAHIKEEKPGKINLMNFAKNLAYAGGEKNRVPFSETRFRQLLSSRNWNELYTRLRRAIKVLNGIVNPLSVADIILRWDEEHRFGNNKIYGYSLKFDLSKEYYTQLEKLTNS